MKRRREQKSCLFRDTFSLSKKKDMVFHACNLSTWKAEAGGLL